MSPRSGNQASRAKTLTSASGANTAPTPAADESWCDLTATELLRMLTLDGARALGLDRRIGSLETGKDADLCAVRIDAPHTHPVHDPAAALLLSTRGSDVILTVVRGQILYRDGRFFTLDPDRLRDRLAAGARRMAAALEER